MNFREYIKNNRVLYDGAFSTYYAEINGKCLVPEMANIKDRETVLKIHKEYVDAGAVLIRTNTFEANTGSLGCDKEELKSIIKAGWEIAKEACGDKAYVAADIGPIETGEVLKEYEFIIDCFIEQGAEIFNFESFADIDDVIRPLEYLKKQKPDAFAIVNFCLNQHGFTQRGAGAERLLEKCDGIDTIDAMGFNCGVGPIHLQNVLKKIKFNFSKPVAALPNSSYPSIIQDRMVFLDNIKYFSDVMKDVSSMNIEFLGGCCGTTPRYIKALNDAVDFSQKPHELKASLVKNSDEHKEPKNNVFFANKAKGEKIIAVELDPPKNADTTKLMETADYLKKHSVDIITFADSPSGRTRADSVLVSTKVAREVGINVMPHICCRDRNAISMSSLLLGAHINDIRNLLVITGDPVPSASREQVKSVFNFDSIKLMKYIENINEENFPDDKICFGGAINYARRNLDVEVRRAVEKEKAGAKYFLTQPVYDDKDIESLKYIKSFLSVPILFGVMPLVSYRNANFIRNELPGITIPDWVIDRFSMDMSKEEGEKVGLEIAFDIMEKVKDIADGYYFTIPFNRLSICEALLKKCC